MDSGDPWDPNPTTVDNVMKMLKCIHRVLKPEGVFVSITFGQVGRFTNNFLCQSSFGFSIFGFGLKIFDLPIYSI